MSQATFRFYAELNDFLPSSRRQVPFAHRFDGRVSIKDMIESLGVPHTEVDLILVNGESVDFRYLVQDGDRISVYPVFESFDITPLLRVRPRPLRRPRFVLDVHLGRLAGYLRLLGFDVLYSSDCDDATLAALSRDERRTLLTRDRGLLKRRQVTHGYCVRATNPREQVREVLRRFDLYCLVAPFSRCIRCNGVLEPVAKQSVENRLPPQVRAHHDDFRICAACGQVYWRGSHYERLQALVACWLQDPQDAAETGER
ncbi:MAG: Mut7-C ubiquitin/RNAse domain-containing protein [Anaerolineae bacterium]|nr:Mut7-C ubiquitin/RNAse domain-containing protein [Anaerolineae bacterium]